MKTTKKAIADQALRGFFFGATEREYAMAKALGPRYCFAFVVLNETNVFGKPFAVLLTLEEVEQRTHARRVQYQVNFRTDIGPEDTSEEQVIVFGEYGDIPLGAPTGPRHPLEPMSHGVCLLAPLVRTWQRSSSRSPRLQTGARTSWSGAVTQDCASSVRRAELPPDPDSHPRSRTCRPNRPRPPHEQAGRHGRPMVQRSSAGSSIGIQPIPEIIQAHRRASSRACSAVVIRLWRVLDDCSIRDEDHPSAHRIEVRSPREVTVCEIRHIRSF